MTDERSMVEIRETSLEGRYVVAGTDIDVGALVHMSLPYATAMGPMAGKTYCSCCYERSPNSTRGSGIACNMCASVVYCSRACEDAHHHYHAAGTHNAYGEECTVLRIINKLGDKITKGRSERDILFLRLLCCIFRKAEMESRHGIQIEKTASDDTNTPSSVQTAQWLMKTMERSNILDDFENAKTSEAKSEAQNNNSAVPAEASRIAAKQSAIGAVEVADPVYLSDESGALRQGSSDRLRRALTAVTTFNKASLLDGSDDNAPLTHFAVGGPSSTRLSAAGVIVSDHHKSNACSVPATASDSVMLRESISPKWGDVAALVSNYSVMQRQDMSEFRILYRLYCKVRALLGFVSTSDAVAADASVVVSVAPMAPPSKEAPATTKKKGSAKPGSHASSKKKDIMKAKQAESLSKRLQKDSPFSIDECCDFDGRGGSNGVASGGMVDVVPDSLGAAQSGGGVEENMSLFLPEVSEFIFTSVCAAVRCNGFGVFNKDEERISVGLYPFASYFNHSCDPNIHRVMVGLEARFFALRPIKRGEKLNISYVDPDDSTAQRRSSLLSSYRFYCRCGRCEGSTAVADVAHQRIHCARCAARGYMRRLKDLKGDSTGTAECSVCKVVQPFTVGLN